MFRDIAQRQINAENEFIRSISETFGYSTGDAEHIFLILRKAKAIKLQVGIGRYNLVHGAYWERDVMERALSQSI